MSLKSHRLDGLTVEEGHDDGFGMHLEKGQFVKRELEDSPETGSDQDQH